MAALLGVVEAPLRGPPPEVAKSSDPTSASTPIDAGRHPDPGVIRSSQIPAASPRPVPGPGAPQARRAGGLLASLRKP